MRVCVCIYIYIYIYACVYRHIHYMDTHPTSSLQMVSSLSSCMYVCHAFVNMCVCVYVCTCPCRMQSRSPAVCMNAMYVYMYTPVPTECKTAPHLHACINTQINICVCLRSHIIISTVARLHLQTTHDESESQDTTDERMTTHLNNTPAHKRKVRVPVTVCVYAHTCTYEMHE